MKQKYLVKCQSCDAQTSKYTKTGRCRSCYFKNPHRYWAGKQRDSKTREAMRATQFKKGKGFWAGKKRGKQSPEWIANRFRNMFGVNHPNYKHGLSGTREYWLLAVHKRKARERNQKGVLTVQQWRDLKAKYDYTCLCCKRQEPEIKLTLDHIIPISRGGMHDISNAQPLCRKCNERKHCETIDYISTYELAV